MRMTTIATWSALLAACSQNASAPDDNLPATNLSSEKGELNALPTEDVSGDNTVEAPVAYPCRTQGGREIAANRLKATGTEPFWSAVTDGRCVTYITPENLKGIRIWTTFTGSRDSGQWSGFLGKDRFVLLTRPDPDCSDGMSDRTYPIAVTLTIGSEERRGCAAPE